jgi:hypothetical protein
MKITLIKSSLVAVLTAITLSSRASECNSDQIIISTTVQTADCHTNGCVGITISPAYYQPVNLNHCTNFRLNTALNQPFITITQTTTTYTCFNIINYGFVCGTPSSAVVTTYSVVQPITFKSCLCPG